MAPKKKGLNGFAVYMSETQEKLAKQGIKIKLSDMPSYCTKDWNQMSDELKEIYKIKGKKIKKDGNVIKYTSIGERVEDIKKMTLDIKSQTDAMYLYIEELVRVHPAKHYLPKQKFILIHINPYTCEKEGFYFPAEITMAQFSLEKGLIRIFHQLLGFDKVRTNAPPAPTADINNHARNYHLIDSFSNLPTDYTNILLKIIGFIIERPANEDILNDSTLDMPPIYTAHCSTGNELKITSSSLYQLFQSAVKNACKDDFNNFLKVFHLDKLFMEMKNMSYSIQNPNISEKAVPSVAMATDFLSKDMFGTIISIGCGFHEKIDHAHVCSNYFVCKWIHIITTHCCQYFHIKLVSGCHYDFDLSKTEVPFEDIIENVNVSVTKNVSDCSVKEEILALSNRSFPALKSPMSVTQQSVWNVPVINTDPKTSPLVKKITTVSEQSAWTIRAIKTDTETRKSVKETTTVADQCVWNAPMIKTASETNPVIEENTTLTGLSAWTMRSIKTDTEMREPVEENTTVTDQSVWTVPMIEIDPETSLPIKETTTVTRQSAWNMQALKTYPQTSTSIEKKTVGRYPAWNIVLEKTGPEVNTRFENPLFKENYFPPLGTSKKVQENALKPIGSIDWQISGRGKLKSLKVSAGGELNTNPAKLYHGRGFYINGS